MSPSLRNRIAAEAARMLVRGVEGDFLSARRQASRQLHQGRLPNDQLPTISEIQEAVHALSGLFDAERAPQTLYRWRSLTRDILILLEEFSPRCSGAVVAGQTTRGAEVMITVDDTRVTAAVERLTDAGYDLTKDRTFDKGAPDCWNIEAEFACRLRGCPAGTADERTWMPADLDAALQQHAAELETTRQAEKSDIMAALRLLLEPLERFRMDREHHPEGDALYHSLQVFELGREALPFDEEFLTACLLHDVGLAIDPRRPLPAALKALRGLVTERTLFLIEHRPAATDYLKTGECPRSLRKSADFETLVLLARCNREGCVPGAQVCTLDEALDYLAGLDTLWDDA
ncbi:MAG: hypothetical protein U0872_16290 [Planctomycetaceae bacterium]